MTLGATGAGAFTDPLAGTGFDRVAEYRDDAAWLAAHEAAPDSRFLLLDAQTRMYVEDTGQPHWLDATERAHLLPNVPASLLGMADGRAWFLLHAADPSALPVAMAGKPGQWLGLRQAAMTLDAFAAGLFAYARGLALWQDVTRYCSVCGAPLEWVSAGHRARCTAADCGRLHFPRTDPAIIVIVENEGACLLGRQASWSAGRYSTLAGFVEPGETLEAAVRREVYEESGVEIVACRYHSSQPWPFPASLMVGFTARARCRDINLRDGELEDARWFTPEAIVAGIGDGSLVVSSRASLSWLLLADWLRECADIDLADMTP